MNLIRVFTVVIMSCYTCVAFAYNMCDCKAIYTVCLYRERHRGKAIYTVCVYRERQNVVFHVYYVCV
eukprot:g3276.t1